MFFGIISITVCLGGKKGPLRGDRLRGCGAGRPESLDLEDPLHAFRGESSTIDFGEVGT